MKKSMLTVFAVAVLVLAAAPLLLAEEEGEIDGKVEFGEQKCVMCHGVAAEGMKAKTTSAKMAGPDLSGFKSDMSLQKQADYLRGEIAIDGAKHKKPFKGTDEELQAIVDWLGSLEAQE